MEGLEIEDILDEESMNLFNDNGTQETTSPENSPPATKEETKVEKTY